MVAGNGRVSGFSNQGGSVQMTPQGKPPLKAKDLSPSKSPSKAKAGVESTRRLKKSLLVTFVLRL